MNEQIAIIYTIKNLKNNYIYVGETTRTLKERFEDHLKCMKKKEDKLLYKDMHIYGVENFKMEQIDACFERHKFIIEEYWYNKFLKEGKSLYGSNHGASLGKNSKQRVAWARNNKNNFNYKSENFKIKLSEATRGEKNGMYGKKGEDAINGRIVVALDTEGNVIHTFTSVQNALKFLGLKGHSALNKACRNGTKYKGYYWKKRMDKSLRVYFIIKKDATTIPRGSRGGDKHHSEVLSSTIYS